jgi:hypothetical protein
VEVPVDRKPLVLVAEEGRLAWIMSVDGKGLSMVRDTDGAWSHGFVRPDSSFDMIRPDETLSEKLVQEALAALSDNPSLAKASRKALS